MISRLILLCILIAGVLGCSRSDSTAQNNQSPSGPVEATDPNMTYTVKLRGQTQGDKTEVTKTRNGSMTAVTANSTQIQTEKIRFDYVETILETSPDSPLPTKVSRTYKVAEKTDQKGEAKSLSYTGKTVLIEKYLKGHKLTADGKSLPVPEQVELNDDFVASRGDFQGLLPKSQVKIGEEWSVELADVKSLVGNIPFPYHKEKSKITGKLLRAYKQYGQQWGVIEWNILMVIDTVAKNGSPIRGSLPSTVTLETPIDASARAGKLTISMKGTIDNRDMFGHEVKTTIEGTQEQSLTPVK